MGSSAVILYQYAPRDVATRPAAAQGIYVAAVEEAPEVADLVIPRWDILDVFATKENEGVLS